jgi:hypothetical protein
MILSKILLVDLGISSFWGKFEGVILLVWEDDGITILSFGVDSFWGKFVGTVLFGLEDDATKNKELAN